MSEVEKKIDQCVSELDPFRIFAPEVDQAVKALKDLKNLVKEPTKENIEKASKIVAEFLRQISPYASYVPTTFSNLKFVEEWLKRTK